MKKSSPSPTLIILILGSLSTVTPFAIDMYLPAFAEIAADFGTTPARISLSITSYFIGVAIGQMIYGPLLDRYGRKKPLYVGLIIFLITCIACTQVESTESLVALRFVQALGGCVAWVAALAMVRDFFPVQQSARIFSLLILVIGLSPLLAPTLGGFIATAWGWRAVFVALAAIVFLILLVSVFFLPEGHKPDPTVSLKAKPMIITFASIFRNPQFYTYSLSGAFAFSTLFIYVAGSPVIFMETYQVTPTVYGGIFAFLSIGFIGGSQLNILINKRYSSEQIFNVALSILVLTGAAFLIGSWNNWYGLEATIAVFFIALSCLGLTNPNATALALAPFSRNIGSASALLGFLQIGVAGAASACIGLFNSSNSIPVAATMTCTALLAFVILKLGKKRIGENVPVYTKRTDTVIH
jgi:MFS transporter, DHA1 family, multidrug resistance protein